jgi:cell division protein FtsA
MSKAASEHKRIIAGLDIGTTKVACVIASVDSEGAIDISGIGVAPNTGMKQGVVVNIDSTTEAIRKAKEEAELMSGQKVTQVWLGVSGTHIQSFDSRGMVAVKNKEVTEDEINRVIEAAKAVAVPGDREVLHVLPREFKVDDQDGIWDPIGMSGVRLEVSVHIITAGHTALMNAIKCTEKAGIKVAGLVLDQLASSLSVVSEDEKNLGVAVVDMGGGTCDVVVYLNGSVAHTSVIPVGGQHVSHDIAVGLRTPQACAEDLKKKYGCALSSLVDEDETIDVEGVGGRNSRAVLKRNLSDIIEPRAEEILNLIYNDLQSKGVSELLGSGIVLTGGASQLDGIVEMGEFVFEVPVRRGISTKIGGLTDIVRSPAYSTCVGLILYGNEQTKHLALQGQDEFAFSAMVSNAKQKIRGIFGAI